MEDGSIIKMEEFTVRCPFCKKNKRLTESKFEEHLDFCEYQRIEQNAASKRPARAHQETDAVAKHPNKKLGKDHSQEYANLLISE